MKQGAWAEAAKLLEKVSKDSRSANEFAPYTFLLLAECYGQLLNPDRQLVELGNAMQPDPSWVVGHRRLAQVLAETGKIDKAITELSQVAKLAPADKATLVRWKLQQAERLPKASRDWSKIERILEELGGDKWDPAAVMLLRAQLLAAQDKFAEARKQAESSRDCDRARYAPWLLLFALAEKPQSGASPTAVLAEAESQLGPRVELSVVRTGLWLTTPAAKRDSMPNPRLELDRFNGKNRNRLLAAMVEAFSAAGERETALGLWNELADKEPNNLMGAVRPIQRRSGKKGVGASSTGSQPNQAVGRSGRPASSLRRGSPPRGSGRSSRWAKTRRSTWSSRSGRQIASRGWARIYLLEALIGEREGNPRAALEKYQAALDNGENRLPVVQRVLELMYSQRQYQDAAELPGRNCPIRRLRPRPPAIGDPVDSGKRRAGTATDPQPGRREALEQARKAVKADDKNARNHAWLGQIAALAGQPKEAEQALRQACSLDKKSPENWVALVVFLARRPMPNRRRP